ncbi:MAG: peptide chain release factor 2 [Candidatus Paceibacterota bacterium]
METEKKIEELNKRILALRTVFDLYNIEKRIDKLEKEVEKPDFWNNQEEAKKISQELADSKDTIDSVEELRRSVKDLPDLIEILSDEELYKEIEKIEKRLKEKENETFFSGKYDKGNAILSVYSGAGGQDAQDWAAMLLRMFERYCERKRFKVEVLDESFGEGGGSEGKEGIKSATISINGKYAYGLLKKENGVHRLVRISPFSAQKLRHTSFALIEVLPEIEEGEVEIKPDDLRIDFYKASGPGGQYVNKRESAVRITHIPSGIVVTCQSERLQGKNKERAMKMLMSKLYQYNLEKQEKEVSVIKGEHISASWGNQIRSYVLHPYKMVKDLRTEVESTQPDKVLDGELDEFIEAEIKI